MTTSGRISVVAVAEPPHLAIPEPTAEALRRTLTLDEAKQRIGRFLIPGHCPDGFALAHATLAFGRDLFLMYRGPSGMLRVMQTPIECKLQVPSGASHEVSDGTIQGIVVEGYWVQVDGGNAQVRWERDIARSLYVEREGRVVQLVSVSFQRGTLSETELLHVARSLEWS